MNQINNNVIDLVGSCKVDEPGGRADAGDHCVDVDDDAELALGRFHLVATEKITQISFFSGTQDKKHTMSNCTYLTNKQKVSFSLVNSSYSNRTAKNFKNVRVFICGCFMNTIY